MSDSSGAGKLNAAGTECDTIACAVGTTLNADGVRVNLCVVRRVA